MDYKTKQSGNDIFFEIEYHNDASFNPLEDQLDKFFHCFLDAITNENNDLLNNLVKESFNFLEYKKDDKLPSFCFSNQISNAFIKSFQSQFYQNLFKYTIYIFLNIYIEKYCVFLDDFFPTDLFQHLWNCLAFTDSNESHMIMYIIKVAMNKSQSSFAYFNELIKRSNFYRRIKAQSRFTDDEFLDFMLEYIYISTNKMQCYIPEGDFVLFYVAILNTLKQIFPNIRENSLNIPYHREVALKLIDSFHQLLLMDSYVYFDNRKHFKEIINKFFLCRFVYIKDFEIYFKCIRVLSSLCDKKYKVEKKNQEDGSISFETKHFKFDIFISGNDIYSKFINDLKHATEIPLNSPNNDIPGHLCNIITRFSKQINEKEYGTPSKNRRVSIQSPFYVIVKFKIVFDVISVLDKRDIASKAKACKLATFFLEGKIGLISQILNQNIISSVASLIESDDILLMKVALKFFCKLADLCSKARFEYNIQLDINNCNLTNLIDDIIYGDDERYKDIVDLAQATKALIIQNIFRTANPSAN